ncbi:hypothetical protein [Noviherbaspirillum pedocola]|uniref:Uncharacterized protein n=1 Tax=Noviherbaspirillum pedocola TaxID=2801341 RepID=A0A934SZV8_9BURK|nr:hypothetical protein [Noviherbaspirillum pedocola]MBK4738754.1 hypothetical protein [Noviherbaspirillum pedocola]
MTKAMLLAILAAAATLVFSAMRLSDAIAEKAFLQERATDAILRWDKSYMALGEFDRKWIDSVPAAADYADLASLIVRTDVAPLTWPQIEKITIEKLDVIEGMYAYKACLSDGGGGVAFHADGAGQAFAAITAMSERKDVLFDGIALAQDKAGATIRFNRFCLLMRG